MAGCEITVKASDLLQRCESSPSLRQQRRLVLLRNSLGVRDIQGYCLIKSSTRGALTRNFPLALWQHVAAWSNQVANVQRQRGKTRDVTPSPIMPSVSTECVQNFTPPVYVSTVTAGHLLL